MSEIESRTRVRAERIMERSLEWLAGRVGNGRIELAADVWPEWVDLIEEEIVSQDGDEWVVEERRRTDFRIRRIGSAGPVEEAVTWTTRGDAQEVACRMNRAERDECRHGTDCPFGREVES